MIRVNKYRPLDTWDGKKICITTGHEYNRKQSNRTKPTNNKEPMICKLTVHVNTMESNNKHSLKRLSQIQEYTFDTQPQTCFKIDGDSPITESTPKVDSLQAMCSTLVKYHMLFPQYELKNPSILERYKTLRSKMSLWDHMQEDYALLRSFLDRLF